MTFFQGAPFTSAYIYTTIHKLALAKKNAVQIFKNAALKPTEIFTSMPETQILQQFRY